MPACGARFCRLSEATATLFFTNALTVGATITVAARSDTACLVCRHDHRGGHRPHCHELAEVQADCRAMRASPARPPRETRSRIACWERAPIETRGAGVTRVVRAAGSRPRPRDALARIFDTTGPGSACHHAAHLPASARAGPRACAPIPTTTRLTSPLSPSLSSVAETSFSRSRRSARWRRSTAAWPVPTR